MWVLRVDGIEFEVANHGNNLFPCLDAEEVELKTEDGSQVYIPGRQRWLPIPIGRVRWEGKKSVVLIEFDDENTTECWSAWKIFDAEARDGELIFNKCSYDITTQYSEVE